MKALELHVKFHPPPEAHFLEYCRCGPSREKVQKSNLDKTLQAARMLDVPATLLEPGHDCCLPSPAL